MHKSDPTESDLITTLIAAELRGVSVTTVNRWVKAGRLVPAIKVPGKTGAHLFRRSDVLAAQSETSAA